MSLLISERVVRSRPYLERIEPWLTLSRRTGAGVVIGNAGSLTATAILTSALGMVFWWVAARNYPAATVGLAAAAVSATTLLGSVSVLGFGTLLMGEVAAAPRQQGSLLITALLITGSLGCALGAVLALVGPAFLPDLRQLNATAITLILFALAVGGTTIGFITDQFVVGLLRSELQLARNVLFALAKLVALVALVAGNWFAASDQSLLIFSTWPIGNVLSLVALAVYVSMRNEFEWIGRPRWDLIRRLGSTALGHHALNLALQAPAFILPVMVTVLLSPTANAYFFAGWMIANVTFVPQTALSMTLFAVGMRDPQALAHRARLTLAFGTLVALAGVAVVWLGADRLLGVFGTAYADQATVSLRILVLAVLPIVIKTHYVALSRVRRRISVASLIVAGGGLVELTAAGVGGALAGLQGVCIGWVVGLCVEAACMSPTVIQLALFRWRRAAWSA